MRAFLIPIGAMVLLFCMLSFELCAGTKMENLTGAFCLAAIIAILSLITGLFCALMRKRFGLACLPVGILMLFGFWLHWSHSPGGNRIIARTTASDGTELCLVQTYTGYWGEPYRVSFYCRRPGNPWEWFYYEHEDTRWLFGHIQWSKDGKRATLYRTFLPVAYFDMLDRSFTIMRWDRTTKSENANDVKPWKPGDWTPESEVQRAPAIPKA